MPHIASGPRSAVRNVPGKPAGLGSRVATPPPLADREIIDDAHDVVAIGVSPKTNHGNWINALADCSRGVAPSHPRLA